MNARRQAEERARAVRLGLAGVIAWCRWYFGVEVDGIERALRDIQERAIIKRAEVIDGEQLRILTCARPKCGNTIHVADDPDRAAARLNVNGWISTDDERLICYKCVPRAMRAGLA